MGPLFPGQFIEDADDQPRNNQPRTNQTRVERPVRQFTQINMTPAQVLPHLLKLNLSSLKEAPKNPNTTSPFYHSNTKCAYHSGSIGHDTNNCWALKNKIQDLIDAKEVEFDTPENPMLSPLQCQGTTTTPMLLRRICLLLL